MLTMTEASEMDAVAEKYQRDGFVLAPKLIAAEDVAGAIARMDRIRHGEYESGIAPVSRTWNPGDAPERLCKIDNAHLSDRAIFDVVTNPLLGQWAAAVTGAKWVQVWATQLLYKPSTEAGQADVGWHQDRQYWRYWQEDSQTFTAWVALSDVDADCGPLMFAAGSHTWGFREAGDFFGQADDCSASAVVPSGKTWHEVAAILPAGAVSFHHRLTYHGSRANRSGRPRRSIAIHMRTERSEPVSGETNYYVSDLDDPQKCPVIYGA